MRVRWLLAAVFAAVVMLATAAEAQDTGQMSAERQKVYAEMKETFGFVPGFFKTIPDVSLAHEWNTMKSVQMAPGAIPNKYRELIGLAVAAAKGCQYCAYFHTQFAKLNGATDAEIEDAVHFAKSNVGWSTYLHGMQYDFEQFKKEVDRICEHVRAMQTSSQ